MLLKAAGAWNEASIIAVADFLGVEHKNAKKAAAAKVRKPDSQMDFNKHAFVLAEKAGMGQSLPMLSDTRKLLENFFEKHWSARFLENSQQFEPCV